MPGVGLGVREIRIHIGVEHRVLYLIELLGGGLSLPLPPAMLGAYVGRKLGAGRRDH
jgi:hypothetical protein